MLLLLFFLFLFIFFSLFVHTIRTAVERYGRTTMSAGPLLRHVISYIVAARRRLFLCHKTRVFMRGVRPSRDFYDRVYGPRDGLMNSSQNDKNNGRTLLCAIRKTRNTVFTEQQPPGLMEQ